MTVLQVHNRYQQPGGEDYAFQSECNLLADRGHKVIQYLAHNDDVKEMSSVGVTVRTFWNNKTYHDIEDLIAAERPDVIHAHNTFPLVSPALYYAAAAQHVGVIQTLHNFRLLCPAATLFRNGQVCEDCVGTAVPYRSVIHGCYRGSRMATAVTAGMLVSHRILPTWRAKVQAFIALTEFSKEKFVAGGLAPEKIFVKPNCLAQDPGLGDGSGQYALFAGRLTEEKGLRTLLSGWEQLGSRIPLRIAGDGPLSGWLRERLSALPNVQWLGQCDRPAMVRLLQDAAFLVFPSEYYENLPMTIIEAFACGTPVIASRLGSLMEIVQDGVTGLHFSPGNANELVRQVEHLLINRERLRSMRPTARLAYERNYTADDNYILLMDIYKSVILTYKRASSLSS